MGDAGAGPDRAKAGKPRKYRKKARAKSEARTRDRIIDSALALLEEGGTAAVNVSAVARGAGVQRLTVYRHFPGGEGIVEACESRQAELSPPPDPADWASVADPEKRLRRALRRLYGYYRASGAVLAHTADPDQSTSGGETSYSHYMEGVLATLAAGWPTGGKRGALVEAGLEHAVRFRTWRSLCQGGGLNDKTAVRLMVGMVRAAARKQG